MKNDKEHPFSDDSRVKRLNTVYRELNYRSRNAVAADIGSNPSTVTNYIEGKRRPTAEFLMLINKRFPQYNLEWLTDGTGEKYNPIYVEINPQGNTISNNSNGGDNIIGSKDAVDEIKALYEQLVESLRGQIKMLEGQIDILVKTNEALRRAIEKKYKAEG